MLSWPGIWLLAVGNSIDASEKCAIKEQNGSAHSTVSLAIRLVTEKYSGRGNRRWFYVQSHDKSSCANLNDGSCFLTPH